MASGRSAPQPYGTLWVRNLDWPTPHGSAPLIPVTFACAGPDTAPLLARSMGLDDSTEVEIRIAAGRRCYAGWMDANLAVYGWVTFDEEQIGELGLSIRLMRGEAYIWDCATVPAYRRRGLYTALLVYVTGALRAEGLCRAWIGADTANIASQRAFARAGFRPVVDFIPARTIERRPVEVRGRPGVPEQVVADAREALISDRAPRSALG